MVELETLSQSTFAADIPVRPPTPPRESTTDERISGAFDRVFGTAKRLFRRTSSITTITPQSSAESPNQSNGSLRKKVGWADLTGYNDVPSFSVEGNQIFSSPAHPLLRSAERKPPKSILKPTSYNDLGAISGSLNGDDTATPTKTTFANMLESTTQQLAGGERSAKVDAYVTLSRALKGTENTPDLRALKPKMELLLSFVKRDITEKGDDGRPEASLALNALVLLCSFFHTASVADLIPLDFAVYIVDSSIKTLEDPQASKDVARHLMFILAKQNFPTKIMNQERIGRLINALHNIESGNLTGKRIMDGRINIYRTLIRQSRSQMLSNHVWLHDMFTDMTSKLKETRVNAITLGIEAGFSLGTESKMTRAVSMVFQSEIDDKGKYGGLYIDRLKQMANPDSEKDSTSPAAVPQIWSVVILFFRGRLQLLERWEYLTQWLKIMSNSFNGSDVPARKEALLAWNRFIFVVHSNEWASSTGPSSNLTKLLPQALEGQLRRGNMRTQAMNTLCCLLYYSFRPTNTPAQYDTYWNDYVVRLVGRPLAPVESSGSAKKATLALGESCTILRWLLDIDMKRNWNEYRIQENEFPANELSPLDPKWVRKSASLIFPVLEGLLEQMFWELGAESEISTLWNVYIKSISSPAIKEVKVSNDTMASVATIFGFLHKIWRSGPKSLNTASRTTNSTSESSSFLKSFDNLVTTLLNGLGTLPFTERQLCMGTQDTFTPIATPSQKPSKLRGEARTPLHHLVVLLSSISPNVEYDNSFVRIIQRLFDPFFASRKSKASRIDLAKTLLEYLPAENTEPCRIIWQVLASTTTTLVDTRDTENGSSRDQPLGTAYKDLVKILEFGFTLARNEPAPRWKSLFDAVTCSAILDAGDSGKAIAVIEPLAASLLKKDPLITPLARLLHFNLLVGKASYPKDRQALDSASKRLWGTVPTGQRSASSDPFVRLYEFIQISLETSYRSFDKQRSHIYLDIIESTSGLLNRCPSLLYLGLLSKIQSGLGHWIQDVESKYSSGDTISIALLSTWNKIHDHINRLQDTLDHSTMLSDHGDLICCALESKHKNMVNSSIKFWNSSFGLSTQQIQYPERLQSILLRLRTVTEIHLPSLPPSLISQEIFNDRQPIELEETQFEYGSPFNVSGLSPALRLSHASSPLRKRKEVTPQIAVGKSFLQRSREQTPLGKKERISRERDVTPRLRHDDSQVQFQPIDSSPIIDRVVDSQMLTDRQKEVRERQQADAGIFQNIGSYQMRRSRSVDESDQELPLHRSSSQLRQHSRERKPTPTLVTPSDDDDAYVASSPTPTRSLRGDIGDNRPPSSPPQSARNTVEMDLDDVPSSSPQRPDETEIHLTGSLLPSAQLDPFAIQQQQPVMSTYGSTVDFNAVFSASHADKEKPNFDGSSEHEAHVKSQAKKELETVHSMSKPIDEIEETILESPSTPARVSRKDAHPTPKTPKDAFVDARGSPASSDIFEDAVSSPRPNIEKDTAKPTSSEMTDLDESSILRALAEVDAQEQQSESSPIEMENVPQVRKSPRKSTAQVLLTRSRPKQSQVEETPAARQTRGHRPQTSSIPSHIPETPANALVSVRTVMERQALTPYDTIVFDDDAIWEVVETPWSGKIKKEKRIVGRKRKFDGGDEEVVNSQRFVREGSFQSSASSVKRPRGRPRKHPRPIQEPIEDFDSNIDLGRSHSQDLIERMEREESSPPQNLELTDEIEVHESHSELPVTPVVEKGSGQHNRNERKSAPPSRDEGSLDIVNETRLEGSSLLLKSPKQAKLAESSEDVFETSREIFDSSVNAAATTVLISGSRAGIEIDVLEETGIMSPTSSLNAIDAPDESAAAVVSGQPAQSVKDYLQGMMSKLGEAALSKEELGELEDMFEEAKCLLFAARLRGRKGGK